MVVELLFVMFQDKSIEYEFKQFVKEQLAENYEPFAATIILR